MGENVILPEDAFNQLRDALGSEGEQLHFEPLKKKNILVREVGAKGPVILAVPTDQRYGYLQYNQAHVTESHLWNMLRDVVESKERVFIGYSRLITFQGNDRAGGSKRRVTRLEEAGETIVTKDLMKKIYGDVISPGADVSVTSPYGTRSYRPARAIAAPALPSITSPPRHQTT